MKRKPNILFIFSDQQRWDTVGCYGQPLDITPNLDDLAKDGVRIENAFTCQPVCGPARACLQTGKYATETGCYRNAIALPLDANTVPRYLSQAGYEVGYVGKWHLASTGYDSNEDIGEVCNYETTAIPPERRGGYKDYWVAADVLEYTSHGYDGYMFKDMEKVEFKGYRVDATTDFVLDYLDGYTGEKPFFLFTSYIEPHHQNDRNRYEGPDGSKERFKDYVPPKDLVCNTEKGDWEENYPDYLGCCASLDENVGRIRKKLRELGLEEDTLIIYTSDHGSHFRTRNKEYKRSCHESAIRVPMILNGPGFRGGKVVKELVSLIDLPATILNSAGVEQPEDMQGYPIQEVVDGKEVKWQQEVFLQISESQLGRAIRTDKWKYCVTAPDKSGGMDSHSDTYVETFLYDLEKDPCELTNLVKDPAYVKVREELASRLIKRMKEAKEEEPVILSAK
ncbi:sulfatase-like hydrolase/transferase [Vallitalea guaymasensis]|uniref:Sulfatase-like hydrolase/transferase n=1 Tax=Vallitalea guaymasensis TaxID=1185412 RepID=A0A8J8M738_9FIRM|nr:sulfatase-like hydrolase/transferase [Vallitalea guaymasensis]QUH27604.1 sulfatase-like hydrolase/transferase [Vallitalea guaymasensis]